MFEQDLVLVSLEHPAQPSVAQSQPIRHGIHLVRQGLQQGGKARPVNIAGGERVTDKVISTSRTPAYQALSEVVQHLGEIISRNRCLRF